jgi:hypothetical protein
MTIGTELPGWVKEVRRAKQRRRRISRRRTISVQHHVQFEPETVTFDELRRQIWGAIPSISHALEENEFPAACRPKVLSRTFDDLSDMGELLWQKLCDEAQRESGRTEKVVDLRVGPVTYHLQRALKLQVKSRADHAWEFAIEQFAPRFVGVGDSISSAKRDFLNRIHSVFQSLVRLRPFRMTEQQRSDWELLVKLIDVEKYWDSVPLTLLEVGFVSEWNADRWVVVWLDGRRTETVTVEQTPPEFAAFQPGQWFEALVEREPRSYALRKLCFVRTTEPLREMSESELRQWLDELPSGENLPKSGSEWATL